MKRRFFPLLAAAVAFGVLVASAIQVAGQGPEPVEWIVFMERGPDGFATQGLDLASARGAEHVQSIPFFDAHVVRASEAYWLVLERMGGVKHVVRNVEFAVDPPPAIMSSADRLSTLAAASTRITSVTDAGKITIGSHSITELRITNVGLTVLSDLSVLLDVVGAPAGAALTTEVPGPGEYRIEWQHPMTDQWTSIGEGAAPLPASFTVPIAGQAKVQVRVTLGSPGPAGAYSLAHTVDAEAGDSVGPESVATVPWHIGRVGADLVWPETTGLDVKVAVLDTGIDDRWGELTVAGGCKAVGEPACVEGGWEDDHGHGTMVASLLAANPTGGDIGLTGVAPETEIYAVKVCGDDGKCKLADALEGLAWAQANGITVANMSFGGEVAEPDALCGAMTELVEAGMVLVAAAGNDAGPVRYPAACGSVIAVGAVSPDDTLASFSSRGPEMATSGLVAPGQDVFLLDIFDISSIPDSTTIADGTSFAAPMVTGGIALLLGSDPALTPLEVFALLAGTALDLGLPDEEQGAGMLNMQAAWQAMQ